MFAPEPVICRPLAASIEILPRQIPANDHLAVLLPAGTRVYLADIGGPNSEAEMLQAARRLKDIGCIPVPHLAARRIASQQTLERRLGQLAEHAGVDDVLVVGGGIATPMGPYASAMDVLDTGIFDRFGIKDMAVAGHPEGSPDFTETFAIDALRQKQDFADRSGARLRIVTQFGFDPMRAVTWVDTLAKIGIDAPVHIGVAGPATVPTLLKYARLCGVGNSLSMFKRSGGNLLSLATGYAPEAFVTTIEEQLAISARPTIAQMHVFPFGGLEPSTRWLRQRGSW